MPASASSQPRRQPAPNPLLGQAAAPAEPLAGLRDAFDGLAAQLGEKLGPLTPVPMEFALRDIASAALGEAADGAGALAAIAACQPHDRSAPVVIGADGAFLDAALEAVFGSDGSEPASGGRAATKIGLRLAGTIFQAVADALRPAVLGGDAAPLELEKVDTVLKLPPTARRDELSVVARIGLSTLGRTGELFVVVPQSAPRGGQQASAKALAAVQSVQDPRWSRRIEQEVQRTQVTLQAVLDERELTLGEIAELRLGQVLPLRATPRSNVKVVCNDQTMFWCELGQTEGVYTLRIKDFPDEEQELIHAITSR